MTIDPGWSLQAVTALDLSALAASEGIASSNSDEYRTKPVVQDDFMGGMKVPVTEDKELTDSTASNGAGLPLRVTGGLTDYDTGLIRPVASSGEGTGVDLLREYMGISQLDQAYSGNVAAQTFTDQQYLGRIVDYVA